MTISGLQSLLAETMSTLEKLVDHTLERGVEYAADDLIDALERLRSAQAEIEKEAVS
jgi:hypothetical protein